MRNIVLIAVVALAACDPSSLPSVNYRQETQQDDSFPTSGEDPHPLDLAIHSGDLDAARRLLEQGVNPNLRWGRRGDRFPLQAVLEARSYGYRIADSTESVRLLLSHRADPNARWCPYESRGNYIPGRPGCTSGTAMSPLTFATIAGSRSIVEMLLEAGADPAPEDWGGATPLDYAYDEVIFELIGRKMFPDLSTRDQRALEWLARNEGSPYDTGSAHATPVSRALRQSEGIATVYWPLSPVQHEDVERRSVNRLNTLMRIGADPNQRLVRAGIDSTPLSFALWLGRYRSASVLLRSGADVNQRWCDQFAVRDFKQTSTKEPACTAPTGLTPLMWAAASGHKEGVELLLEFKADRTLKDWADRTAFDYASTPAVRELLRTDR